MLKQSISAAVLAVSTVVASSAQAAVVTYTIVPAQSTLTIGGSLAGSTPTQQTAGSLSTTFTGTIAANRTASAIAFNGGSTLDAALQASNQQPRNDATPGSQSADYGRTATLGSPFFATAYEAFRNVVLDVFDDTSGAGSTVAGNGTFNSANLGLEFASGSSDVLYGNSSAEIDFASPSRRGTSNSASAAASSVVTSGNVETLTLRFITGPIAYSVATSSDSNVTFSGTIVATRAVPEPTAAVGLIIGGLGVAFRRRP